MFGFTLIRLVVCNGLDNSNERSSIFSSLYFSSISSLSDFSSLFLQWVLLNSTYNYSMTARTFLTHSLRYLFDLMCVFFVKTTVFAFTLTFGIRWRRLNTNCQMIFLNALTDHWMDSEFEFLAVLRCISVISFKAIDCERRSMNALERILKKP